MDKELKKLANSYVKGKIGSLEFLKSIAGFISPVPDEMQAPTKSKKQKKDEKLVYHAYVDGSALRNPGPGGYASIVTYGDTDVELFKGYFLTTNNRMEIMAVIATLEEFGPNQEFIIYSDSQYTIDGSTKWLKGWKRNKWISWKTQVPIKNQDLWIIMEELLKVNKVQFVKVKAHSGIPGNEKADVLAKKAAGNPTTIDSGFVKP